MNTMIANALPLAVVCTNGGFNRAAEGQTTLEPYVGLEFNSADEARQFYSLYATHMGFKIRTGQLYRSRADGSVSSRRFVCSKEGFQLSSRTGCPAFIRVQRCGSGKWVLDQFQKDHNHDLCLSDESDLHVLTPRNPLPTNSLVEVPKMAKVKLLKKMDDGGPCPTGMIKFDQCSRIGDGGQSAPEPIVGLEFSSSNEAYLFYQTYARSQGFRVRIGQLFRSKNDGMITSRRFVCSKEGFQHPSRLGCGAYMRVKRQGSASWTVDRLQKEHNHDLGLQVDTESKTCAKKSKNNMDGEVQSVNLVEVKKAKLRRINRESKIGSEWYSLLLEYFQAKQAQDTGFFHSVDVDGGKCTNMFWADGRSRFSAAHFGDVVIFDTSYRKDKRLLPFATFVGINHHRQPVLFGCALVADESKKTFTWLLQTWAKAVSGCHPRLIIADQDRAMQEAISEVFPRTHHGFSIWQIREKEQENLGMMPIEFRNEYEKCIYQSQTTAEFDSKWNVLISKYGLVHNAWLKHMYEMRGSWVPLYLKGKFLAEILLTGSLESFFGSFVNGETPLSEFTTQYELSLEQRRDEERREDFNSFHLQAPLKTKELLEEQCRKLYTLTVFKIFQAELVQSYNYIGIKTYQEGTVCRYLVRNRGNENDKYAVTFSAADLTVNCGCQMFESQGVLCRHVLKVFKLLDIREIPSCYILQRWTKNAQLGYIPNIGSVVNSQELKAVMVWSLRETASKYVEYGVTSFEKYKLASEILHEGTKQLF